MEGILAATLILVIVLALLALTLSKYADFWFKVLVVDPFEMVNSIMMSEEVPAGWRIWFIESLVNRNKSSSFWRAIRFLLLKWYLFRLDRLVHTIKISSKIRNADKAEYFEAFKEIRSDWGSNPDLF